MSDHRPTKLRAITALGLLMLGLLAGALLTESGLRLRQYVKYGTTNDTVYDLAIDPISGLEVPVPNQATKRIRMSRRVVDALVPSEAFRGLVAGRGGRADLNAGRAQTVVPRSRGRDSGATQNAGGFGQPGVMHPTERGVVRVELPLS